MFYDARRRIRDHHIVFPFSVLCKARKLIAVPVDLSTSIPPGLDVCAEESDSHCRHPRAKSESCCTCAGGATPAMPRGHQTGRRQLC